MKNDKYSQSICKPCMKMVIDFYLFREECFQTNVKFIKLYNSVHNSKHNEDNYLLNKPEHVISTDHKNLNNSTHNEHIFIEEKKPLLNNEADFCDILDEATQGTIEDSPVVKEFSVYENSSFHDDIKHLKFLCTKCNKIFRSKYSLIEHNKIHLAADKFKCKLCEKQFTRYE